tara:strand:- start:123 stop:980 length:858 start_codon:yes stop_codon:yes gene_type:complete
MQSRNYKVDIEAGNAFVERLKLKAPGIGGFSGMYEVPSGYKEPVLVSGADGVGTKIKLADYSTIGIDLVAMCVNDVICCGAKPLYFLDYISTPCVDFKVDLIMEGIVKGCEIAGIELIGGETAEHVASFEIDLAGFCTGVVEKKKIIDGSKIKRGDKIIGIPSSGVHSNGFTLINDLDFYDPQLSTPTIIYAEHIKMLLDEIPILGMAHITGGGLEENISRVLPKGLRPYIDWNTWTHPDIFLKIMEKGNVPLQEMKKVFNMGIGFVLIVPSDCDYGTQIGEIIC